MAGRDPRLVSEADHQWLWLSPNPNTNQVEEKSLASAFEKDRRRLLDLGIEEEELQVYRCSVKSPIQRVNELNNQIVEKLNSLASVRRGYFALAIKKGAKGVKKDKNRSLKSMAILKTEILEAQRKIRELGGVSEKFPDLFDSPVKV